MGFVKDRLTPCETRPDHRKGAKVSHHEASIQLRDMILQYSSSFGRWHAERGSSAKLRATSHVEALHVALIESVVSREEQS